MKLYAIAIACIQRTNMGIRQMCGSTWLKAANKDEALGKALNIAFEQHPASEGYMNHQAVVTEIPLEAIKAHIVEVA